MKRISTILGLALLTALAPGSRAAAHTESDLVAVPAGAASTITLKPTHGCGESPTVVVRIRAPFPDARAGAVDGWTATSTPDGAGNTVLEWTGGLLPADQDGAFPVEFTAPGTPGALLTFPAIQVCENGEELAWISGDPADEYPAPRVLVLPAGSEPAATIDDVPLDAPGRDQLIAIVDVDNPQATTTTATPTTAATTTTAAATTTTEAATTTTGDTAPSATPATTATPTSAATGDTISPSTSESEDDGGSSMGPVVAVAAGVAVVGAGSAVLIARRRSS